MEKKVEGESLLIALSEFITSNLRFGPRNYTRERKRVCMEKGRMEDRISLECSTSVIEVFGMCRR